LVAAHQYIEHSVTYGYSTIQAAYILNGGALAALPALLTSLTTAGAAAIALPAVPFMLGIAAAAAASLATFLNYQWLAATAFLDSNKTAAMLGRFYQGAGTDTDQKQRDCWRMAFTARSTVALAPQSRPSSRSTADRRPSFIWLSTARNHKAGAHGS
jgi:hypothetical protein